MGSERRLAQQRRLKKSERLDYGRIALCIQHTSTGSVNLSHINMDITRSAEFFLSLEQLAPSQLLRGRNPIDDQQKKCKTLAKVRLGNYLESYPSFPTAE